MSDTKLLQLILATCERTEAKVDNLLAVLTPEDDLQGKASADGPEAASGPAASSSSAG